MARDWIQASYGGANLLISTLNTTAGRDIIVQSPARGDKHVLQDRGLKMKSTHATILFVDQPNQPNYLDRFDQFQQAAELDVPSVFTHPILGTYNARIADLAIDANDEAMVTVSCMILAEEEPQVVFQASAGVSVGAGVESVGTAATTATNALSAAGITSSLPASCSSAVTGWAAVDPDDLDTQQVELELQTLTSQIDDAVTAYDLESNLNNWSSYQALINLRYQLTRAAEAATSTANNVFDLVVASPRPLLAICAEVYGPTLAQQRWQQISKNNRIRTPGLIPAGTTLKMVSDGARA